jgi:hypothetical protein
MGYSLVHFEGLCHRNAALGAEIVPLEAEIGGGNTIRNVVTAAVTKSNGLTWVVTCSPDSLERVVDLECLGDRHAALGADVVPVQAEIRGGNTNY